MKKLILLMAMLSLVAACGEGSNYGVGPAGSNTQNILEYPNVGPGGFSIAPLGNPQDLCQSDSGFAELTLQVAVSGTINASTHNDGDPYASYTFSTEPGSQVKLTCTNFQSDVYEQYMGGEYSDSGPVVGYVDADCVVRVQPGNYAGLYISMASTFQRRQSDASKQRNVFTSKDSGYSISCRY